MKADRRVGVSVSLAFALFLAPANLCAAATPEGAAAVAAADGGPVASLGGGGCSRASRAVLDDIVGGLTEDPFQPYPAVAGGGGATDPPGCGRPPRTRKGDPGNPVVPVGRPTSSFTITGTFP